MGDDSEYGERSLRGPLIAVVMFAGMTAGLVAAYTRAFGPGTDDAVPGTLASDPRATIYRTPPALVRQFHADLRAAFGSNARGLQVVSAVDYDEEIDRLHIVLSLDHTLDAPAKARASAMRRVLDVLKAFRSSGLVCGTVLVTATAPVTDLSGDASEAMVVRCQFPRDRLDRADWPRLTGQDVPALAEQFWLYPDLELAATTPTAPTTAPTTAPATQPVTTLADDKP